MLLDIASANPPNERGALRLRSIGFVRIFYHYFRLDIMKLSELIARLETLRGENGDLEVVILDGFNAGGEPRTINVGPSVWSLDNKNLTLDTDDIGTKSGNIVVMGYGSY